MKNNPSSVLKGRKRAFALAALVSLASFFVVFLTWYAYQQSQKDLRAQELELKAEYTAQNMQEIITASIKKLDNLRYRLQRTNGDYFEYWADDARLILQQSPGYKFIEWIDSNMVIRRIEPLAGNEAAINLDISQIAYRKSEWISHIKDSSINVTPWAKMTQGGYAFLVDAPVFYDGRFQGTITAGLNFQKPFDKAVGDLSGFSVQLMDDQNSVFYTHNVQSSAPVGGESYQTEFVIDSVDNQSWQFKMWAANAASPFKMSTTETTSLIAGIISCILIGVVVYFYLRAKHEMRVVSTTNNQLKRANVALDKERKRAEEASRSKTNFLSTMSHEIRTPLNAILGFIDVLKDAKLGESEKEQLEMMDHSSKNLLALVNDILEIDKIESGKIEFRKEVFSPAKELVKLLGVYRSSVEQKGLYLKDNLSRVSGLYVVGDPGKFGQIYTNLLRNAIKFTDLGGIELKFEQDHREGRAFFTIVISDTGMGIPKELQQQIFDRFTQVEGGLARLHEGTGLGLAITSQLLDLMGGTIEVKSTVGLGSSFITTLSLPLAKKQDIPHENQESLRHSFPGKKLLVVEDNPMNVKLLEHTLKQLEIKCSIATNGEEALAKVEEVKPELILMDIHMPVMDGVSATRELRSRGFHKPIVALSANVTRETIDEAMKAGMQDYITKPFTRPRLLSVLTKYL